MSPSTESKDDGYMGPILLDSVFRGIGLLVKDFEGNMLREHLLDIITKQVRKKYPSVLCGRAAYPRKGLYFWVNFLSSDDDFDARRINVHDAMLFAFEKIVKMPQYKKVRYLE